MSTSYLKLFVDCLEKYQKLNDTEFGRLVRAALRYKATGAEPDDLGREALLWDGMRLDIDRDNESYAEAVRIRSEAGKAGAAARWKSHKEDGKNAFAINRISKNGKHGKEEDKDKEEGKDLLPPVVPPPGEPKKHFVPPSVEEVRAYCQERGNGIDPEGFVDFYAARGWVVGKTPMKDWKAAVRTWESRDSARKQQGKPTAQDMSDDAWRYV